jgi:glycosyltransferase involved in cell wall biosynthesis
LPRPFTVACIPAYNEEKNLAKVLIGIQEHVDQVIVCDDGSADMTGKIAEKLGAVVIKHTRNLGYGAALRSLFEKAIDMKADIVVTVDSDGQHNPGDIPAIIQPIIDNKADIVIGSRFMQQHSDGADPTSNYRRFGIKTITKIANIVTQASLTDSQSGFRAYNKKALNTIQVTEQGMGASTEIIFKAQSAKLVMAEVPIVVTYGKDTSTHNSVYHATDVVISTLKFVSIDHPLRFYGIPGVALLAVGIFFSLLSLQIYVDEGRLVTNTVLLAIGSVFTGIVLIGIAVILYVLINVVRDSRRVH